MLLSQWQDSVCFDSEGFFRDRRRQAVVVYTQRWTGLMVDVQSCVHFTKFVPFWHSLEVRREYHAITLEQHVRLDVSQRDPEHIRHCSFWHFRCKVKAGNGCISEAKLVSVFRVFSFRARGSPFIMSAQQPSGLQADKGFIKADEMPTPHAEHQSQKLVWHMCGRKDSMLQPKQRCLNPAQKPKIPRCHLEEGQPSVLFQVYHWRCGDSGG